MSTQACRVWYLAAQEVRVSHSALPEYAGVGVGLDDKWPCNQPIRQIVFAWHLPGEAARLRTIEATSEGEEDRRVGAVMLLHALDQVIEEWLLFPSIRNKQRGTLSNARNRQRQRRACRWRWWCLKCRGKPHRRGTLESDCWRARCTECARP